MQLAVLHFCQQTFYADTFRNAMRIAAELLIPDEDERVKVRKMDRFPRLAKLGVAGSYYQALRFRHEASSSCPFLIELHAIAGHPSAPTLEHCLDIGQGFDPAYFLQAALWDWVENSDRRRRGEVADRLREQIGRGIDETRAVASDETVVAETRIVESRMGGLCVLPQMGRPSLILARLPDNVRALFLDVVEQLEELRR